MSPIERLEFQNGTICDLPSSVWKHVAHIMAIAEPVWLHFQYSRGMVYFCEYFLMGDE